MKKSAPATAPKCARRNVCHEVGRAGTGGSPCLLRIRAIVERPTRCPGFLRAPWILLGGSYNLEIKHLALAHAFPFVDTVVFCVAETNWRSQRAMEKIGGVRRPELQPRFLAGQIYGHVVFEITERFSLFRNLELTVLVSSYDTKKVSDPVYSFTARNRPYR